MELFYLKHMECCIEHVQLCSDPSSTQLFLQKHLRLFMHMHLEQIKCLFVPSWLSQNPIMSFAPITLSIFQSTMLSIYDFSIYFPLSITLFFSIAHKSILWHSVFLFFCIMGYMRLNILNHYLKKQWFCYYRLCFDTWS